MRLGMSKITYQSGDIAETVLDVFNNSRADGNWSQAAFGHSQVFSTFFKAL